MINTTHQWREKEDLERVCQQYPAMVLVDGLLWGENAMKNFSGSVGSIPFGATATITHKGKTYHFKKGTNGKVEVY
jgi:hypothetical protein